MQDVVNIQTAECTGGKHLLYFNKVHCMIQGSRKEHSHGSQMEQGRNLGGGVEWNIGKTKRTKRTISTIRMMEQGQATWRGFGPSSSGKSPEVPEWIQEGQGKAGKRTSSWKYISKDL